MKKSILVPRITVLPQEATEVPKILDEMSVPFEPVAVVNWPDEFPYCPDAAVHGVVSRRCRIALSCR